MSGSAALDPKPAFAAVAATNAAITALARAFAEQGIKDGLSSGQVDDRNISSYGWRGDQRNLEVNF
jgi:hypothetical protein